MATDTADLSKLSSGEPSLSRRSFLKRSFAFSAASVLAGCGSGVREVQDAVSGGITHYLMVGDWGKAGSHTDQTSVATAMRQYQARYRFQADALLMLGDNFYGAMPGGVTDPRWQSQFEQMYPATDFAGPAYAVPGNHDYQYAPASKIDVQLAYAAQMNSRWQMPSRYYNFVFPPAAPTVTFLALDSNMPGEPAQPIPPNPGYYTQTDAERLEQLQWLEEQLAKPLRTSFLVVIGHHPLYSNGPHGDNQTLIRDWGPLFEKYGVHLYLAGHDHDLQHLEIAGRRTSFVTSGAGGAELDTINASEAKRGPYAQEIHGFTHLQVRPDLMIVRHLDTSGNLLHKFTKTPAGVLQIQR